MSIIIRKEDVISGTRKGGIKARDTNLERHGKDFYKNIGAVGGSKGFTGGFYGNPELAKRAGKIGGRNSHRRTMAQIEEDNKREELRELKGQTNNESKSKGMFSKLLRRIK